MILHYFMAVLFNLGLWINPAMPHPLHLSVTNLEINSESGISDVNIKLFADDLSAALRQYFGEFLDMTQDSLTSELNRKADEYLRARFYFMIDGKKLELGTHSDIKRDSDAVYLSYQIQELKNGSEIELINSMLIERFADQKNLVFVNFRGVSNGLIFNLQNQRQVIDLNPGH
jgi:hypothetical protein